MNRERGLTLVELLVVMVVTFILVAMILPATTRPRHNGGLRIQCVNNLKQDGLAFRIWEGDNGDRYPMAVPNTGTNGGSMDSLSGPNAFRTFQVMSNELSTPRILICPSDASRWDNVATNWINFGNSNISYFVGVDATETNASMILSGDRNITNGTAIRKGLLALTTNTPAGWTSEMHNKVGNILLADGSVQQVNISGLQNLIANTGVSTNRLQMPVPGP